MIKKIQDRIIIECLFNIKQIQFCVLSYNLLHNKNSAKAWVKLLNAAFFIFWHALS